MKTRLMDFALIVGLCLACIDSVLPQDKTITQFAVWKPLKGQEDRFEAGYRRHLLWHKQNGDIWDWYGWMIVSGPRAGQFIDATTEHAWSDFDSRVNPAGDRADNMLNVEPFGEFQLLFRVANVRPLSAPVDEALKSKIVRLITLSVKDIPQALKVVAGFQKAARVGRMVTYRTVDGGDMNQILLMIGLSSYSEFSATESIQDRLREIETSLGFNVVTSISSETLVYRSDLSLFPAREN